MSSSGKKVNDPHSFIQESTGPITADSLAAESTKSGGAFGRNPNSEPQGVTGSHSTFTTTNTSGATRLDPASDAESRMAQMDWAKEKKLHGGEARGGFGQATGNSAPGQEKHHASRPKGANLQEGGFDSDDQKNASFTSDIGTGNDPGRVAERTFQISNANSSAGLQRDTKRSGDTLYKNLENETAA